MLHLLLIIGTIGAGVIGAHFFPTEEMLQDRFALGQKYYAANDHQNSVQVFGEIEKTPNYALLNVDEIEVSIGDLTLPIRVAATYQLGNSYRNVGRTKLERSRNAAEEGDSLVAVQRLEEGRTSFNSGKGYYRRLAEDEENAPLNLRVMALYQIIRASYQMENYPAVVREAQELLERFPGSEYEEAGLYDKGWAYYHMGEYAQAIETFGRLLGISTDALKTDRALFQTGESYFALGEYAQARSWYKRLVDKYDFSALSEKELQEMKTQRLRGLVQETTRELVAKAQIRIADAYAAEKRVDDAIAAYSLVPVRYPQEDLLVQKSFDNMAAMVLEQQGVDAGIAVLRQAIEQVEDPLFRGRAQLKIAKTLFAERLYRDAIDEYSVYKKGYGDRAGAIGVTLDQVDFLMAEAHRELARDQEADRNFRRARELYQNVLDGYPQSPRAPEAYYGLGHAHYGLGETAAAIPLFAAVVEKYPRAPVAPYALDWQARLTFSMGESEEAVGLYQRLTDDYPGSALENQAWKDKGLLFKQMGRLEEAIDAFSRVGRDSQAWAKVQAEAGDLLLAAGRGEEIVERFDLEGAIQVEAERGDTETLAELHYIKGRIAREGMDYRGEVEHLSAALENSGNERLRAFALFFRGLAYYSLGTGADAAGDTLTGSEYFQVSVDDLERLLQTDPAADLRAVAYRTRGVALTRLGRSADAVNTYKILIAAAPTAEERSEFELMLMELYYDQGQLEQTEEAARGLIAAEVAAGDSAGKAIKERAYFVLVSLLLEQERYEEALTAARQALQRYPQSANRATLLSVSARSLFFLERYEEAIRAFDRFIAAYPEHPDLPSAYYQLGYCHEILGQYERAAGAFRILANRYPDDALTPDALYRCGENLYNGSKFQDALEVYLELSREFPQTAFAEKALYSASWTYMDLDQEQASIAAMERLVDEYPGSDYARYAQFSIGDYYYSKKEFERAQEAYRRVIEAHPGTQEAQKAAGLLVDIDEDLASREYDEVFVEFDRGNYAAAADGFERIYARYPRSYSALAALANKGVALEHLGNSGEARQTYEKVLEMAADNPDDANIVEFVKLRLNNL